MIIVMRLQIGATTTITDDKNETNVYILRDSMVKKFEWLFIV